MRDVWVAGIGSTTFGRHKETAIEALGIEAANAAILEAAFPREEIGAVYLGNFVAGPLTGQEVLAGIIADGLNLGQVPCTKVEGACASGGIAFRHAWLAVAHGLCDAALAVGVEKMSHADTATVTGALNCAMDNRADGRSGLTFPGLYGLAWQVYDQRYGASREDVAAIITKNKRNGLNNPLAQMGAEVDLDQIVQSPMICDPLQLFDCCPVSDGAAAVLLVAAERAGDLSSTARDQAVRVVASVQTRGSARIAGHSDLSSFGATVAAGQQALTQAGLRSDDIDFVELHDCFSIAEALDLEDLGLIPRGQALGWAREGRTGLDGDLPVNASGGLLAKGHPVGATGLGQVYEAVLQLRGAHANQVAASRCGPRFGMTHNLGGTGVACTVSILGRTDA